MFDGGTRNVVEGFTYKSIRDKPIWGLQRQTSKGKKEKVLWGTNKNHWIGRIKVTFPDYHTTYSKVVDIVRNSMVNAWIKDPIICNKKLRAGEDPRKMGKRDKVFWVCHKGRHDEWLMNMLDPKSNENIPTNEDPMISNGFGDIWENLRRDYLLRCDEVVLSATDEEDL